MPNTNSSPLVSVIITTYNRKSLLPYAIQSVLNQTYSNYEIIVVNDYGEDVFEVVESFKANNIKYLSHLKNLGLPFARNTGIKASKGEIICYLDDDDLFLPLHLETLIKVFNKHDDISIVYTEAKYVNEIITEGQRKTVSEKDIYIGNKYAFTKLMIRNYIPINCISHRKYTLEKVGLFDENIKSHEDWDFLIRFAKNYHFYYINQVTVEVRNRINLQDNMLSQGKNNLYETYKTIYSKHSSNNIEVLKKRQKLLYHLSKSQKKSMPSFLKLLRTVVSFTHIVKFSLLYIRGKYASR